MSGSDYLNNILSRHRKTLEEMRKEDEVFEEWKTHLVSWFNQMKYELGYSDIYLSIEKSGSRAKGTAIRGKSDIDIFLSITDRNNRRTLEEYYEMTYNHIKTLNVTNVRKQNVSIGVVYKGYSIDIVPAKKVNSLSYERLDDHYLWSTKRKARMLTNIQKQIDTVKISRLQNIIILTKLWRENHKLEFPSIYIELMVISALQNKLSLNTAEAFWQVLLYIKDNIMCKKIVDPGNGNNIISDDLTQSEKRAIQNKAIASLGAEYWQDIVW